jgi:Tfp pilus assembly PilM family ATPase
MQFMQQLMPAGPPGLTVVVMDGRWVKVLQATGRQTHRTITLLLAHPIEGLSDEDVIAWLREACAAARFEPGSILLGNPAYLTTTRLFTLPSTDPSEIRDIVALQAEKHTPYAKEEILTDFQVLETDPAGYSRVLLVISHQDVVHRGLRLMEGLGWTLERVGFESEGLVQWALAATEEATAAEGAVLVAEIDADTTTAVVVHRGKPVVYRSLAVGLVQLLADAAGGPAKLSGELQRTLETLEAEGSTVSVKHVLLTGQAGRVPGLAEQVQQQVNVPTTIRSAFEGYTLAPGVTPDEAPFHEVAWASLLGLGLGRSDIDLTPHTLKLHRGFEIRSRALVGLGCQLIALLLLLACVLMGQSYKSERYYTWLSRQHASGRQALELVGVMAERLALVKEWQRGQGQLLEMVMALEAHTPDSIHWSTLTYTKDEQVILKGTSTEMPKVFEFTEAVKQTPVCSQVETRRVTKRAVGEEGITDFELVCALVVPEVS